MKLEKNYIVALGIIGLIAAFLSYYFGSRAGKARAAEGNKNEAEHAADEVKRSGLTFELSTYDSMANKIFEAVNRVFTDEDAVYSVFARLQSKDDLLQLIKVFGGRGWPSNKTLSQWLYWAMNTSEINYINSILERNSVDFHF